MCALARNDVIHLFILSDFLTIQDGFHQFVAAVAQSQQEEGGILPQKIQEDLVTLPFGQVIDKFPADPLQVALVAFL